MIDVLDDIQQYSPSYDKGENTITRYDNCFMIVDKANQFASLIAINQGNISDDTALRRFLSNKFKIEDYIYINLYPKIKNLDSVTVPRIKSSNTSTLTFRFSNGNDSFNYTMKESLFLKDSYKLALVDLYKGLQQFNNLDTMQMLKFINYFIDDEEEITKELMPLHLSSTQEISKYKTAINNANYNGILPRAYNGIKTILDSIISSDTADRYDGKITIIGIEFNILRLKKHSYSLIMNVPGLGRQLIYSLNGRDEDNNVRLKNICCLLGSENSDMLQTKLEYYKFKSI